jgi:transcription termination factor NusB
MDYNIYCDESCHLEHDRQKAMVLGAIWCPRERVRALSESMRAIKQRHGLQHGFEIKWTKVSPAKVDFYREVIEFFFNEPDLHFRALVVPDKTELDHERRNQTHDQWYYKMYFDMLKVIIEPTSNFHVYLDIKDTKSGEKTRQLHDVLSNNNYDFNKNIVKHVQTVHSHEIELLQLADLIIGVVSYANRNLSTSPAKNDLVEITRRKSGYSLSRSTLFRESKFNLFIWHTGFGRNNGR